ncbi:MAG: tetratricopeptide repeat protein [Pirellulaceae bacterium]
METIVLRAIHSDYRQRYSSMDAMANDLRRFVRGEPIEARRPLAISRWLKGQVKHYRTAAMLLVGLFVILSAWFAITPLLFDGSWRKEQDQQNALLLQLSDLELKQLEHVGGDVSEIDSRYSAIIERLETAATGQEVPHAVGLQQRIVEAKVRWSETLIKRKQFDQAERLLDEATSLAKHLPETNGRILQELSAYLNLARINAKQGRMPTAGQAFDKVMSIQMQGIAVENLLREGIFEGMNDLTLTLTANNHTDLALGVSAKLMEWCRRIESLPQTPLEATQQVAIARNNRAALLFQLGHFPESIELYEAALKSMRQVVDAFPNSDPLRQSLGVTLNNLGRSQTAAGRGDDAEVSFRQAIAILYPLANANANNHELQRQATGVWRNLSILYRQQGKSDEAAQADKQARRGTDKDR